MELEQNWIALALMNLCLNFDKQKSESVSLKLRYNVNAKHEIVKSIRWSHETSRDQNYNEVKFLPTKCIFVWNLMKKYVTDFFLKTAWGKHRVKCNVWWTDHRQKDVTQTDKRLYNKSLLFIIKSILSSNL